MEDLLQKYIESGQPLPVEIEGATIQVVKGSKGDAGDTGEKGEQGDRGETGPKGADGKHGKNGKDGKDGKDGLDGLIGERGPEGKQGRDGRDGNDGSPDTGLEIAKKVNAHEEIIERKVIKGLNDEIARLNREIIGLRQSRGGGGMSNIINESFIGDGVTTSFTLSDIPKTNSLLVFYNGETLKPTTHYSISGKTLSLTATPLDGLSIWVWYVRR